jgi:hypothetical protein
MTPLSSGAKDFFEAVTADAYVVTADGRYGNPDLATLAWIVEVAQEQGRSVEVFATNATPSTCQLIEDYDPDECGYRLIAMEEGVGFMTV